MAHFSTDLFRKSTAMGLGPISTVDRDHITSNKLHPAEHTVKIALLRRKVTTHTVDLSKTKTLKT